MLLLRRPLPAALAAVAALTVGAPAAGASPTLTSPLSIPTTLTGLPATPISALPIPATLAADACAASNSQGQARTGGNAAQACVGAGLSFIGPSSDVSTVIGPAIISPAFVGTTIVAGGNVAIAP